MKTRKGRLRVGSWNLEAGTGPSRRVLECGDTSPLSSTRRFAYQPKRGHVRPLQKVALLCFLLLPLTFCLRASAQSYSIDWYKIAGGGGTSTNGQYSVTGTIGQHDAGGPMTGGGYQLAGGFWALISILQTPGAPTLYIKHSGNTVTVFWQDISGWNLQQNSNLAAPSNWSDSGGVTTSNGTNYLNLPPAAGNLFFRLVQP